MTTRPCHDCGKPFSGLTSKALFCSSGCRGRFNRRRRERGTELYDVVMASRFDISGPDYSVIETLTSAYRMADSAKRAGRRSWQAWSEAQMALPQSYGSTGDGR